MNFRACFAKYGYLLALVPLAAGFGVLAANAGNIPDYIAITNEDELQNIALDPGKSYRLANEIYITKPFTPIGTEENPFTGVLEGNGKAIYGMNIDPSSPWQSVFGVNEGTIIRVRVAYGNGYGELPATTTHFGGMATINRGFITSCTTYNPNRIVVTGPAIVAGGIAAENYGQIKNSESNNIFQVNASGNFLVGGLSGVAGDDSIFDMARSLGNFITQSGLGQSDISFGCIAGMARGNVRVENCYLHEKYLRIAESSSNKTTWSIAGAFGKTSEASISIRSTCVYTSWTELPQNALPCGLVAKAENTEITLDTVHVNASTSLQNEAYAYLEFGEAVKEARNAYFTDLERASRTEEDLFTRIAAQNVNPKSMGFDIDYWGNSGISGYLAPRF